jgi:hypothetical protein
MQNTNRHLSVYDKCNFFAIIIAAQYHLFKHISRSAAPAKAFLFPAGTGSPLYYAPMIAAGAKTIGPDDCC